MDMRIDSAFIRDERQKRGWSQEQLAAAAGLGVRTIQRLEASGTGSPESAKCLAAVFEVPYARLMVEGAAPAPIANPAPADRKIRMRLWGAAAAVLLGIASSLALVPRAIATDIAMAIVVGTGTAESRVSVKVESGQQTEVRLAKSVRLVMTPTLVKDGNVLLATELYRWDGGDFVLSSTPKLLMRDGEESTLQVNLGEGQVVRISVTPKVT